MCRYLMTIDLVYDRMKYFVQQNPAPCYLFITESLFVGDGFWLNMDVMKDLKDDLAEFCSTTSIQGMRNVTDPKQGCFSRSLWLIIVIASFVLSGICIKESIDGKQACKINYSQAKSFF